MMKFGDIRINPDDIKKYYPVDRPKRFEGYKTDQTDEFQIVFEYKTMGGNEVLKYKTKEERDKMLEAIDETLLILKDGEKVIPPHLETIIMGGGDPFGSGSPGGNITMQ